MLSVSVIIPAYQSASTIINAIESILAQIIPVTEIIVIDDGSTDNLGKVLENYQGKIILLKQVNRGAASARNNGIKHATGDIIAFLDADDLWLPEKLSKQLPLFENPQVSVVYGNVFFLYREKFQIKTYFDFYKPQRGSVFQSLFEQDYIPLLSVMVRRSILDQVGIFDESIRFCEDYDLLLRISKVSKFDYVENPVAVYRISSHQMSKNLTQAAEFVLKLKEQVYLSSLDHFKDADKKIVERGLYNKYLKLALCYLREGKTQKAKQILVLYPKSHSSSMKYILLQLILVLPLSISMFLIRLWDKVHQQPEYGYY